MQRLGKNLKGYAGERIDIDAVLRDCVAAAEASGWAVEAITSAPQPILGLTRPASPITDHASRISSPAPRLYISTGIHGDEPAGPLAARQLLRETGLLAGLDVWLCPCLNPAGFALNRRENRQGLDLNRQYRTPDAGETLAHIEWLQRQPGFDLCLCLHEDWEAHGFYVYELNPDKQPSLAEAIVAGVGKVCPIDPSEVIEGRPAASGIIRPGVDPRSRPDWPEAFYLITHKTRLSYTLEAPSDFPLATRVAALVAGVTAAVEAERSWRKPPNTGEGSPAADRTLPSGAP